MLQQRVGLKAAVSRHLAFQVIELGDVKQIEGALDAVKSGSLVGQTLEGKHDGPTLGAWLNPAAIYSAVCVDRGT